jgi:hypothetical protein
MCTQGQRAERQGAGVSQVAPEILLQELKHIWFRNKVISSSILPSCEPCTHSNTDLNKQTALPSLTHSLPGQRTVNVPRQPRWASSP